MKPLILGVSLLFIAGFLAHNSVKAQRTTATHPVSLEVYGQARYGDNRAPAANILVRLETFGGGVVGQILTDRDGKFRFSGLASTQYTLFIHAAGYADFRQAIDLLTQTSDYVNVFLVPEEQLSETRKTLRSVGYIDASVPIEARKEFEKAQMSFFDERNFDQAVRHLEKALSLYPRFFEAELSLGTLYMDIGKWEQAESSLRHAVEINGKVPNAYFALGEVYFRQARFPEAEKILRDGLLLDNRSWKAHFTLARVYWKQEDLPRTGRQLALTLQLNPNAADAHLLAAKVLMRARKFDDALSEFQEYLRLEPKGTYADQARITAQAIKAKLPAGTR
jgi:tetratricopeptide (TPR) repeat protein